MGPLADTVAQGDQHTVEHLGVGVSSQRRLLCLAHLGGSNHLHRLGDLGGVLNRLDASADVAGVGHELSGSESGGVIPSER